MADWLSAAGADALILFWWPVVLWTVAALAVIAVLRFVPDRFAREQYELRTALLAALPVGILLGAVYRIVAFEPLFVINLPYEIVVHADGSTSTEVIDLSAIEQVSTGSFLLVAGAAVVGLAGAISFAVDLIALTRFESLLEDVTDSQSLDLLRRCERENGIRTPVRLVSSDTLGSPAAFGWLKPTVVIPTTLLDRPEDLRMVLLHETAHLARGDFLLDTLARLVRTVFGWHPLVAFIFRSSAYWREAACDLAVIGSGRIDRSGYARLLLSVAAERRSTQPVFVASMATSSSLLTRRIEAMTRIKNPAATLPIVRHALVLAILAAVVSFTACSDTTPAATDLGSETVQMEMPMEEGTQTEKVHDVVDVLPQLIDGVSGLAQEIRYPETAKKEGVQGRVFVSFIVEKNGAVSNVTVVEGVDERLDAEAVRAVETRRFEPGKKDGKHVRTKMTLPIAFRLE